MTELEQAVTAIMDALRKEGVWMDEESYGDISHAVRKEIAGLMPEDEPSLLQVQMVETLVAAHIDEIIKVREAQIAKGVIEEAVKDLTKDGRFQWRDGQVYAEEILDWLDKGGE